MYKRAAHAVEYRRKYVYSQQYYTSETRVSAWKCVCVNAGKLFCGFCIFGFSQTIHKQNIQE